MGTVIGPIDHATWYSMRQCREAIAFCKAQKNDKYDIEIKGEEEILGIYMKQVLGRAA